MNVCPRSLANLARGQVRKGPSPLALAVLRRLLHIPTTNPCSPGRSLYLDGQKMTYTSNCAIRDLDCVALRAYQAGCRPGAEQKRCALASQRRQCVCEQLPRTGATRRKRQAHDTGTGKKNRMPSGHQRAQAQRNIGTQEVPVTAGLFLN